jgi:hypothetical protein
MIQIFTDLYRDYPLFVIGWFSLGLLFFIKFLVTGK